MSLSVTGFDYDNFNPEGVTYPPNGDYVLAIIGEEEKPSKDGHRLINVHFEIASGEHSKKQFKIGYYVGNPDATQAQWAFEALGRLYFATTGLKPTRAKGIIFDDMRFKPFNAIFEASPNAKGDIFPKIKNLKPMGTPPAAAPTQQGYAAPQAAAPSWGAR